MTFTVIVEDEAERDWDEAVAFYDERESEISHRFNAAVRDLLHTFSRQPERFRLCTPLTHKAKIPEPWPYSVYFTINLEHREVKILAIWHGARNPVELRSRLK
ncbi:MAG TPA: type II toxin-antitoxin system RelE/ParE family toxin [Candidatus Saccharimonadales bacterium]|nr:type II toxin-antitoxin system RelE/ParE family toxin [Candidatus Saccharimonadales bacterium]